MLFCAMLAWCLGLIFFRVERTGSEQFLFMIWNMFLACIPLFASRLLQVAHVRKIPDAWQLLLLVVWLLFLPNAPYVITDLIHLQPNLTMRLYWYDMALLLSCGAVGVMLGYASTLDVHRIVEERFGQRVGWAMAVATLLLSGFAIYLGRVLRWNSWDVVTNPGELFVTILDHVINPYMYLHVWAFSGLCGLGLLFGYLSLHWLTTSQPAVAAD
jgi:uncharacterized membrane protein